MNKIKNIPLKYFIPLLLIIITFTVFCRIPAHKFVAWDDNMLIYNNPYMNPVTSSSFRQFWKNPHDFALTHTFWAIQSIFARTTTPDSFRSTLNPHIFHTTNLFFHILSVLLVFLILRILIKHDWAAFGGALFFAIHPVQVEPVAWVTGLKDVLSGFLSLAAVWQYLLFTNIKIISRALTNNQDANISGQKLKIRKKYFHYILATLAFILAMMSKPTAVIVPIVVFLLDYLILRRGLKQNFIAILFWLVLALPMAVLAKVFQPDITIKFNPLLWTRPLIMGDAIMFYLYKLFFPVSLGIDYGRTPQFVIQNGSIYYLGIIPFLFIILAWVFRKRSPWPIASIGIFIAGILPVSGLILFYFQNFSTVADRYLYFSMLGPVMALAWFLSRNWRKPVIIIYTLILILLGICCQNQTRYWKNTYLLFKHALKVNPDSGTLHNNMGMILNGRGKYQEAIIHLQRSIYIKPDYAEAYYNMGAVLYKQKKYKEAVTNYSKAIHFNRNYTKAYYNRGNALEEDGKINNAIDNYLQALKADPDFYQAYFTLGEIFQKQGRIKRAITNYLQVLRIKPDFGRTFYNLGACLEKQGNAEGALAYYSKAIQLKPGYARSYFERGNALFRLGRLNEAVADYKQVLKIIPNLARAHNNLGYVLETQGKFTEAISHYSAALRINPGYKNAGNNLLRVQKKLK